MSLLKIALSTLLLVTPYCVTGGHKDFFIRRCTGTNTQTTCKKAFVGRFGEIEIDQYDIAFDFDDETICLKGDHNVATSHVPIQKDDNQGPLGNVYNTIQTNKNCFGGMRGNEPSCESDYTIWFPEEGSDNENNITGARVEASLFPPRPCVIPDGCNSTEPINGDDDRVLYDFNAKVDYICANLDENGYFENGNLFLTTCSISSFDGVVNGTVNSANVTLVDGDTFGGSTAVQTYRYGSFKDEDCSFGLPDQFDIETECVAAIVEHHGNQRNDDHVLVINGVDNIYIEMRTTSTRFDPNSSRNRYKVKFLCGKFDKMKYRAYRCKYNGPASDFGDGGSTRYVQFNENDCSELDDIDSSDSSDSSEETERPDLGPRGDECLAYLRRTRQCGDDYSYRVINEGDDLGTITNFGPGVAWELDDSTCTQLCNGECGDVDVEVDFLCPKN